MFGGTVGSMSKKFTHPAVTGERRDAARGLRKIEDGCGSGFSLAAVCDKAARDRDAPGEKRFIEGP